MIKLSFHGAARTVTGSRYLLEVAGEQLLIDCGMFQGLKALRELNWKEPAFNPHKVKWMLLTHAHIDHSGAIPRLVKQGFEGEIISTTPTAELARFMLMDSAHLQMEDALFLNRRGKTKHQPALPLYTTGDAEDAIKLFRPRDSEGWAKLSNHLSYRMINVGHLLGSAMIQVKVNDGSKEVTILFSGDVGRYGMPLNPDPSDPPASDYLVVESTYGDRCHCGEDVEGQLTEIATKVLGRGGLLIVPAFAVGRAQQMIYLLRLLTEQGKIPRVAIYFDSPMGLEATALYRKYYRHEWDIEDPQIANGGGLEGSQIKLLRTQQESMSLNDRKGPAVIISSSGMLTGGRILHHLSYHLGEPDNYLLLSGYQAAGTRGRAMQEGAKSIRIHKEDVAVNAEIGVLHGLSGHADFHELARWLKPFPKPMRVFITHGEEDQARALARRFIDERQFPCEVPAMSATFTL